MNVRFVSISELEQAILFNEESCRSLLTMMDVSFKTPYLHEHAYFGLGNLVKLGP